MEVVVLSLQHPGTAAYGLLHHRISETGMSYPILAMQLRI